ncbi:DUF4189 domain-containing protein [Terrarubrum flagellatum]|uniref:DUF4189 domain-containing protein n=1 Tax=Terrirubrum flagellatum TaxID=2895980 RepID=UPI0031456D4F
MKRRISAITTIAAKISCHVFGAAFAVQLAVTPAFADGAIALGRPANIATAGVAIGVASNYADTVTAAQSALEQCRSNKSAPASTKALCRLVAHFKDQCAAVALDRKDGTPGFGWSIGVDKASAQDEAMAVCRATAGKGREKFCEQSIFYCDGAARQP